LWLERFSAELADAQNLPALCLVTEQPRHYREADGRSAMVDEAIFVLLRAEVEETKAASRMSDAFAVQIKGLELTSEEEATLRHWLRQGTSEQSQPADDGSLRWRTSA
jgi:hypothetical protein